MNRFPSAATLLATLFLTTVAAAQTTGQTTETPPPAQPPSVLSDAAASSYERRDAFPSVNIYLPEGQATIRLRKLIRNVLFESQIDYEFVDGDISTYLRYKYYARNYTYRIGVFDAIEFPQLGEDSTTEFERVRGGLLLVGVPRDYNNRNFFLLQNDRLTFGDLKNVDNRKNNIYAKIGYQYGTQFDERMNGIVGETRGRITPVLTAFRDLGPQRTGLAAAVTQSARIATGDYQYTKLEAEALRRFDVSATSFIFSRLHVGSFVAHSDAERDLDGDGVNEDPETFPEIERYSIPRYEMFRLGGREALKSISADEDTVGTQEVHLTNELFVPIFRNKNYKLGPLYWTTMYGIGYVGAGAVAFKYGDLADGYAVDAGVGTESAITLRDFEIYLSVVVATTIEAAADMKGTKVRFSIRTVR